MDPHRILQWSRAGKNSCAGLKSLRSRRAYKTRPENVTTSLKRNQIHRDHQFTRGSRSCQIFTGNAGWDLGAKVEWTDEGRTPSSKLHRDLTGATNTDVAQDVSSSGQIGLLSNPTNRKTNVRLGEVANGEGLEPKKSKKQEG